MDGLPIVAIVNTAEASDPKVLNKDRRRDKTLSAGACLVSTRGVGTHSRTYSETVVGRRPACWRGKTMPCFGLPRPITGKQEQGETKMAAKITGRH